MTVAVLSRVLPELRRVALAASEFTDGQLLDRFVSWGDEAAFEGLLRRLGPRVWALCQRMLPGVHDAEDAFQAAFLVLVRKAASVIPRDQVGAWLYGVAYRTALKARVLRRRRDVLLQPLSGLSEPVARDCSTDDLRGHVDSALARLPNAYRAPLLLCELDGVSRKEAARRLGVPEGTLSSRLARGRRLLARRLRPKGIALPAGSMAALLGALDPASAVSPALVASTVKAATGFAAGNLTTAAPAAALAEGVLRTMAWSSWKIVSVFTLLGGLLTVGWVGAPGAAEKPAAVAAKEKPELGPTVRGTVVVVDAAKSMLTIAVQTAAEKKQTEEKSYPVAPDAKVILDDRLSKETEPATGKLSDLSAGTSVTLQLALDKKSVVAITARGPGLFGMLELVDPARGTLTVKVKTKDGPGEHHLTLAEGARITLSDGLTKDDKAKEAKLTDLAAGTPVRVQLTVDRKKALTIQVEGRSLSGTLKGIDLGSSTVTVEHKGENGLEEKTFTLAKNAQIGNVSAGLPVHVRISVFDPKVATHVRPLKE